MSDAPALHVLGCGRAARAVARVLLDTGQVRPGLVVNRSIESARSAVEFLGAGEAAVRLDERVAGGWLMLGLPDGALAESREALASACPFEPALAFHLSGSVAARVLAGITGCHAAIHPVRAFADPQSAARQFAGTWCVAEGEDSALAGLRGVFEAAGARWLAFAARDKSAWHAATVAASNYLATIHELARALADRAGLPEERAGEVLCDLQQGMLDTLREHSPREALTGPIERGDEAACQRLVAAAEALGPGSARLFSELGLGTLALAREKRGDRDSDRRLERLFSPTSG